MGTWYFHAYPQASGYNPFHAKGIAEGQALGITSNDSTPSALFGRTWSVGNFAGSAGYIAFPGNYNLPTNRARTYHIRVRPKYTGNAPGTSFGLFGISGIYQATGNINHTVGMQHGTDGTIRVFIGSNIVGFAAIVNNFNAGSWSPTSGVAYDIGLAWDGTTTANSVKVYLNGSLLGQTTPSQAWTNPVSTFYQGTILIGQSTPTTGTGYDVEEFAIGDGADFNMALFTGSGRTTNVIGLSAFQGITWPAVAKVKSDTSWNEFGVAKTGTRTDPTAAQVKNGVQFGAGGTEFTGTVTLPAAGDVEAGVQYGAAGNEFTGTLETGASDPGVDNVLEGVEYEIAGIPLTGTYGPVTEAQVQDGVEFGPNDSLTGSFGRHIPQTNQYWAPLEAQAEIYTALATDDDIIDLLGEDSGTVATSTKVFDFVPDKKAFPYITLNILPFTPRDNATNDGLQCEFQINVWYAPGTTGNAMRGNKPVQLIQKRIDELLQNRNLCINGWNTLQLRRSFIDILTEADNVTKHGVQRFSLFLGSKD